jgi:poly(3-hydroxybutyrate) depolymerase
MMPVMPPPPGSTEPVVPMVTAECPTFRNGTITFMGLGGINVVAGAKAASPTAPMVFYWHGTGSFAGEYATMAGAVSQGVSSEGGVLISFQGTTGGDLLSGTAIFGKGDLNLTDQLLACAVKNHNVDPKRVFSTGCSAGGLMSASMATLRSNYMAAAAPNSGGWTAPLQFQNKANIPALMTVHGRAGVDVVIIDFATSSATADKAFKGAGGFVVNCDHGGGHCGGGGLAGDIWKFFKAHPFGTKPSPWASALPAGFSSKCKLY